MLTRDDTQDPEIASWFREGGAELLRELGIRAGQRVLDFGCGFGSYSIPLAQVVAPDGRVIAVDTDADAIERLRQRVAGESHGSVVETHVTGGEVSFGWLLSNSLDAALVFDVLQHVGEWEALLGELARLLKSGGYLYVNPSTLSHPGQVDMALLQEQLATHGFELQHCRRFRLMHYKHMTEDEVYVFRLAKS